MWILVVVLARRLLYIEELVMQGAGNPGRHRPVLCCSVSVPVCAVPHKCPSCRQSSAGGTEEPTGGSAQYWQSHHPRGLAFSWQSSKAFSWDHHFCLSINRVVSLSENPIIAWKTERGESVLWTGSAWHVARESESVRSLGLPAPKGE